MFSQLLLLNNLPITTISQLPSFNKIVVQHTSRVILASAESLVVPATLLQLITGQKPTKLLAKKSVATWNVRQGDLVGVKVTLRNSSLVSFLQYLSFYNIFDITNFTLKLSEDHHFPYVHAFHTAYGPLFFLVHFDIRGIGSDLLLIQHGFKLKGTTSYEKNI